MKERLHQEAAAWHTRSLADLEVVYLWVDGVYVKAGLEKDKAALLVAIGGLAAERKVLIALRSGYRESTESWNGLLRDARQRGLRCPRVVIGDGHLGIWAALREVYPDSDEQRCWNHRIVNVPGPGAEAQPSAGEAEAHAGGLRADAQAGRTTPA